MGIFRLDWIYKNITSNPGRTMTKMLSPLVHLTSFLSFSCITMKHLYGRRQYFNQKGILIVWLADLYSSVDLVPSSCTAKTYLSFEHFPIKTTTLYVSGPPSLQPFGMTWVNSPYRCQRRHEDKYPTINFVCSYWQFFLFDLCPGKKALEMQNVFGSVKRAQKTFLTNHSKLVGNYKSLSDCNLLKP